MSSRSRVDRLTRSSSSFACSGEEPCWLFLENRIQFRLLTHQICYSQGEREMGWRKEELIHTVILLCAYNLCLHPKVYSNFYTFLSLYFSHTPTRFSYKITADRKVVPPAEYTARSSPPLGLPPTVMSPSKRLCCSSFRRTLNESFACCLWKKERRRNKMLLLLRLSQSPHNFHTVIL